MSDVLVDTTRMWALRRRSRLRAADGRPVITAWLDRDLRKVMIIDVERDTAVRLQV
ncbi:hypothetical protein [Nonomuraea jabiensis]|uniref:hypothetical protein n=1 Tax=Nonomuraea jabiensis TaxID=882448 RepID=UPI003D7330A1